MSFKFIATQVISEPKFSMIINRTLHPSYRSFKNNVVRQKVPLTSQSLCCCSPTVSGSPPAQLSRSYSTNLVPDSRITRKGDIDFCYKKPSTDIVNKYLKSLTGQARKTGGSLKKFEPCYRPLYPSKKCPQPTYKIPRKLPYVPAVFQQRRKPVIRYNQTTPTPQKHPTLVQWPPLYKCKKKDVQKKSKETRPKTGNLPPWLLPLYSYKAGRPVDMVRLAEARFSGGAFHRKMEVLEGIKEIRDKQQTLSTRLNEEITRKVVNKKPEPFICKRTAAVNELKRKIGEMYAMMGSMKRSESFLRTRQIMKESETIGDKGCSNKDGQLDNSVKNQSGAVQDCIIKSQATSGTSSNQNEMSKSGYSAQSLRQVDPQTLLPPQNSSEMQGTYKPASESKTVDFKVRPHSHQMEPTTISRSTQGSKDQSMMNNENIAIDSNEWSVQSLKSRINDMLTNEEVKLDKITSKYNEVVEVRKSNSDGLRAQVNRPSNRSFHRCSLKSAGSKLKKSNSNSRGLATCSNVQSIGSRFQLKSSSGRSCVGRRCLSTFSLFNQRTEGPKILHSARRRSCNQGTEFPMKKSNWITRVKRCFVIKKTKGVKVEDWKKTPRKTPYCANVENTLYSPSPVLWMPKEKSVTEYRPANPVERTNPVVLNAEQRIMASINRIVPIPNFRRLASEHTTNPVMLDFEDKSKVTSSNQCDSILPDQQEAADNRLSEIEKKVRKAEIKVNILPLPWPNEVKNAEKITKLPELSSSLNDKLSGGMLTEMERKKETGYEWIMKNKQIVEDIKDRSRQFAGKPLVPSHVKQSIEEYKLPLKAQISQYRKSIERKAHGLYLYSTARRWYCTSCCGPCYSSFQYPISFFANSHPKFLRRSNMGGIGTRNVSNNASQPDESQSHRTPPKQNTSPEVPVDSEFYKKYALRPMYGDFSRYEPLNRLANDPNSTRNLSNMTTRAKALPQRPAAPLTSPNKMLHKVGDSSSTSLRKQVDDLKRLIRKSKGLDYIPAKVEVSEPSQSNDSYETKLRKLVRAAQANSRKLKFVEPKYHTENNLLNNFPSVEKRGITIEPLKVREPIKPEVSNSSYRTPFTKLEKDSRVESKSSKTKPQVSQSMSLDSFHRNKKPFSNMYVRLKSFIESVRRKSTQETPSTARIIPSNKLKGSISVCALLSSEAKSETKENESTNKVKDRSPTSAPITVELRGGQIATPASSVQLWKTERHPKPPVELDATMPGDVEGSKTVLGGELSNHGELMSLLTRAKELITFHSQLNVEEHANIAKLTDRNPSLIFDADAKNTPLNVGTVDNNSVKILSPEEITQSLLTKPETLKFATEIAETEVGQINAKASENKTKFWPVLTFLPQSVFGKMDQVHGREENDTNSVFNQDGNKSCDTVQRSLTENMIASDVQTPNIQSKNETQENKTNSINEKQEETLETSSLAATSNYTTQDEAISAHPLPGAFTPLISHVPDSASLPSEATAATTSVEPKSEVAERPVVNNNSPQCYDSNVPVAEHFDLKATQKSRSGLVMKNNMSNCKDQSVVPQKAGVVTADDVPKCEGSHSGQSVLDGVSSVNWESFSKNIKDLLSRNDATNFKYTEQESCPPSPKFSNEIVTCKESVTENDHPSPQLDQTMYPSITISHQFEHTGNHNLGEAHSSCMQSDFQEFHSSSVSHVQNYNVFDECSGISSDNASQMPSTTKYDVDDITVEEEKVEAHIDEMNSRDRQSLSELLAKDPTINPELVKKLKLPAIFPEDCSEKTWCTRSRND